jgi:protein-S-isoprenylcysteine O-methyltransferase Ste14
MHDFEHGRSSEQSSAEVANAGLIRPPFVYLGSIGLGLLVHFFWPMNLFRPSLSVPLGVLVVLVAGVLFIAAMRTFRKAGTPVPATAPTKTIVRKGPYRFSRNPVYLAFTLFKIGLAAWVNIESRFPTEYLPYKCAVRRWL